MKTIDRIRELTNDAVIQNNLSYLDYEYEDVLKIIEQFASAGFNYAVFILNGRIGFKPNVYKKIIDEDFEINTNTDDIIHVCW